MIWVKPPACGSSGCAFPRHIARGSSGRCRHRRHTRAAAAVPAGPIIGTIIKPNVGLSAQATGTLAGELCAAGVDFIKDDEVCANPGAPPPTEARIKSVMRRSARLAAEKRQARDGRVQRHRRARRPCCAMRSSSPREGGSCVMASLNWCGFSSIQALRRSTDLALHGHRNGFGLFARDPALGMGFQPYQAMWRLAGVDHMHVHGLQGKFAQATTK
jgi:ribulose-bisphosphate carboxylase large chain